MLFFLIGILQRTCVNSFGFVLQIYFLFQLQQQLQFVNEILNLFNLSSSQNHIIYLTKKLISMKFIGCSKAVNVSGSLTQNFEVSSVIKNQSNHDQFLTIAHDGKIKIWNTHSIQPILAATIKSAYLTSLLNFNNGFIVGTGDGQIIKFNNKLQKEWTIKVHHDCVTDLLEIDNLLVSIGSDGKVCFMNKIDLTVVKELNLQVPLNKLTKIKDILYIASNPSFKINLQNFQVTQQRRSLQFLQFDGRILSCSDERGLQIMGFKSQKELIPCHFMLVFHNMLITVWEQMIGLIDLERYKDEDEMSYRLHKVGQLKKGFSIKAGLSYEDFLILVGQEGLIYKFQFRNKEDKFLSK